MCQKMVCFGFWGGIQYFWGNHSIDGGGSVLIYGHLFPKTNCMEGKISEIKLHYTSIDVTIKSAESIDKLLNSLMIIVIEK